jgi:phage gpG-like protein
VGRIRLVPLIDVRLELPDIAEKIRKKAETALSVVEPLEAVARKLLEIQAARFAAGDFPPALKASTLKKKRAKGQPDTPLVATGALRDRMTASVEMAMAILRPGQAERWYANILQSGGGPVPARPLFKITDHAALSKEYEAAMEGPIRKANAL